MTPTWPSWWREKLGGDLRVRGHRLGQQGRSELDGKAIDVVWNGMTLTDAVQDAMECTNAYCNNAQVVVTK